MTFESKPGCNQGLAGQPPRLISSAILALGAAIALGACASTPSETPATMPSAPASTPAAATPPAAASASALPAGVTAEMISGGGALFKSSTCAACHGAEGGGTSLGPDLTSGTYVWGDGSVASIKKTIADGVSAPKNFSSPMPPMGGQSWQDEDLQAVAAYVWSIGHKS